MLLGFDIGGTKCAVVTAQETDGNIDLKDKKSIPTDLSVSPETMIDRLIELADSMVDRGEVTAVGVSCGSPLDSKKGIIMSPPNLKGWDDVHIVDILKEHYGVPVHLQNDANACAVAEWKFGAGKGASNMIFLTFGTGFGAGLILNGALYSGTNDNAGEVGHIRAEDDGPEGYGKRGSYEGFCSGGGIAQLGKTFAQKALEAGVKSQYADGEISAKTVADSADAGDATAIDVYKTSGEKLGKCLAMLIDLLNPEKIVIGSIFARSRNLLWDSAKAVIERECLGTSAAVCEVVPAQLGEHIGDYAAIGVALLKD